MAGGTVIGVHNQCSMTSSPGVLSVLFVTIMDLASVLFSADAYYRVVEAGFLGLVIYLALTRAYKPRNRATTARPTETEVAKRIAEWKPRPLAEKLAPEVRAAQPVDVAMVSAPRPMVTLKGGNTAINCASNNFLALIGDPHVEAAAVRTLREYGCGACGPRGFYGTTDVHLKCETALAKFSDTEHAILYSFGAATGSSTIPAFCKRGDVVIVDEAINFCLQTGVNLSRAQVLTFTHNDPTHLEALMKDVCAGDSKHPSRARTQKRFVIVEGIYQNMGDLAPLDAIVSLKKKYNFRLILDESFSLGVLGTTGRGALEHFAIPRDDVDIATADLGNAIASVGGYCVGATEVVSHQRLSGAGYCFSASQPPFLATAATTALDILTKRGATLTAKLRANIKLFQQALETHNIQQNGWTVNGAPQSPVMHIRYQSGRVTPQTFTNIQRDCLKRGVLVARPVYVQQEETEPEPSIKIAISAGHTNKQLHTAAQVVSDVLRAYSRKRSLE